jgi:hypothetical protein
VNTPSENTLELNVTHEMLTELDGIFGRKIAKSPTRVAESDLGFDVQLSFARRVQFQYKRPQGETSRGVTFAINGDQVSTLRMRDPERVAYLVCPMVLREDNLPGAIHRTAFIDVHAVNTNTSRIYVPSESPVGTVAGSLKIKNAGYYPVPKGAIYDWMDIYNDIINNNIGMFIKRGGDMTQPVKQFRKRLVKLTNLYSRDPYASLGQYYLTDGGDTSDERVLNEEHATDLIDFALEQRQMLLRENEVNQEIGPEREVDEQGLRKTIARMEETQSPSTFRIGRSTEYIFEREEEIDHLPPA